MKKSLILFIILFFIPALTAVSLADNNYRFEISGEYSEETDSDSDTTLNTISAFFFFNPIETGNYPYYEADFIEHKGGIGGRITKIERSSNDSFDTEGYQYDIEAVYVFPVIPIYVGAGYLGNYEEPGSPYDGEIKSNVYIFQAGYFFLYNLLTALYYIHSEFDMEMSETIISGSNFLNYSLHGKGQSDIYGFLFKYVHKLPGGQAFNIDGSYSRNITKTDMSMEVISSMPFEMPEDEESEDKSSDISVAFDYYLNRMIGIGVTFSQIMGSGDTCEGKSYGLRLTAFLLPRLAISFSFEKFKAKDSDCEDGEDLNFRITGRI